MGDNPHAFCWQCPCKRMFSSFETNWLDEILPTIYSSQINSSIVNANGAILSASAIKCSSTRSTYSSLKVKMVDGSTDTSFVLEFNLPRKVSTFLFANFLASRSRPFDNKALPENACGTISTSYPNFSNRMMAFLPISTALQLVNSSQKK